MNDSWIALVDHDGLKLLVLETSHALHFLQRRAERQNAECFWVVLTRQHAGLVEQLCHFGSPSAALNVLEHLATDVGRFAPPEPIMPVWFPDGVTIPDNRDKEWGN